MEKATIFKFRLYVLDLHFFWRKSPQAFINDPSIFFIFKHFRVFFSYLKSFSNGFWFYYNCFSTDSKNHFYHPNLDKRKTNGASKAPYNQSRLALSIAFTCCHIVIMDLMKLFFLFFPFIELPTHPFEKGEKKHLSKLKDLFEALRLSHDMFYENW